MGRKVLQQEGKDPIFVLYHDTSYKVTKRSCNCSARFKTIQSSCWRQLDKECLSLFMIFKNEHLDKQMEITPAIMTPFCLIAQYVTAILIARGMIVMMRKQSRHKKLLQ